MTALSTIPLTKGYEAIVYSVDFEAISKFCWHVLINPKTGKTYARATIAPWTREYLHRFLVEHLGVEIPKGLIVHHKDGNGLNCARDNLVVVPPSLNSQASFFQVGLSGYRGVDVMGRRYRARISVNDERRTIGVFDTAIEAAHAYDMEALRLFGPFAFTNFPRFIDDVDEEPVPFP